MALFRFPTVEAEVDVTQKVAVRDATTGKFYFVTIQDIIDLAVTEGVSIPSITDDGTTVDIDADVAITGDVDIDADVAITGDVAAVAAAFSGALSGDTLKIASHPPATAGATGVAGTIAWDAGFIYICTATNTWKRVAIATW